MPTCDNCSIALTDDTRVHINNAIICITCDDKLRHNLDENEDRGICDSCKSLCLSDYLINKDDINEYYIREEFPRCDVICDDCIEEKKGFLDEISDMSHIIPNESESYFWEHEDEDGPFGSPQD